MGGGVEGIISKSQPCKMRKGQLWTKTKKVRGSKNVRIDTVVTSLNIKNDNYFASQISSDRLTPI